MATRGRARRARRRGAEGRAPERGGPALPCFRWRALAAGSDPYNSGLPVRSIPRTVLRESLIALFFLALAAVATRPLVLHLADRTLPGPDPLIDLWTVHWLSGHAFRPSELFDGNIFHPLSRAALYSDLSLGTAVLLVPLRAFVSDPVPLYNLGLLLALAFGGWSFCSLTRALTRNLAAGLVAGILAAFGSHQMSHVYHLNLLSIGWLALLLLGLQLLAARPGPGAVALTGVSFALSAQSSGYYAVAAALLPLVFAGCRWRELRRPPALRATLAAAALGALLTAPYLLAFDDVRERDGLRRPPGMSRNMAFQPGRDLTSYGLLYRPLLGSEGERLFPGLLSLGLAGLALRRRRPHAGYYSLATGVLLVLSLGPELRLFGLELSLPYAALFAIPPLDSMRHPYTFAAVATMTLSVLAGIGLASLAGKRAWAGPTAVAIALAEAVAPAPATREVAPGVPPIYEQLLSLPAAPALEVPLAAPDVMLWAARQGRPTINGDGAFLPKLHGRLDYFMKRDWLRRIPDDADATPAARLIRDELPVRYLIVPCGRQPSTCGLAGALNRSRLFALIHEAADGDRLYEVKR